MTGCAWLFQKPALSFSGQCDEESSLTILSALTVEVTGSGALGRVQLMASVVGSVLCLFPVGRAVWWVCLPGFRRCSLARQDVVYF